MKYRLISRLFFSIVLFFLTGCATQRPLSQSPTSPPATNTSAVHLKNGSLVKGIISETIPDSIVKVQTTDGSLMVFKFSEIEKIEFNASPPPAMMMNEKIEIGSGFFGQNVYFYKGEEIAGTEELRAVISKANIPETATLLDEADSQIALYNIVGGVGGAMIGWPVGAALAGQEFMCRCLRAVSAFRR